MECYIMYRKGTFKPKRYTSNQCKIRSHSSYNYSLAMVFPSSVKLDQNYFIVDHHNIDKLVNKLYFSGSCEQMHNKLSVSLKRFFKREEIEIMGFKCSIRPESDGNVAFMDYVYSKDEEHTNLMFTLQNH